MLDHATAKLIVYNTTRLHTNDVITLFKPTTSTTDIYREEDVDYDAGLELQGVVRTDADDNMAYILGKTEKDRIRVTIPRLELENKGLTAPFISTKDRFTFNGVNYTIDEVKFTGRVGGDYTIVELCAKENPEEV